MKWTGLTGGIATGKSTAKKLIEGLGFPVVDADQISHMLTGIGAEGYQKVLSQFGKDILAEDLSLDRKKLATLVFNDMKKKEQLEAILHPLIQQEVLLQKSQHQKAGVQLCFYDVPLLFEKNLAAQFDYSILIWCDAQAQVQRLMSRNKFSLEDAMLRIKNQLPLIEKVSRADYCVDNSGGMADLEKQLKYLIYQLLL